MGGHEREQERIVKKRFGLGRRAGRKIGRDGAQMLRMGLVMREGRRRWWWGLCRVRMGGVHRVGRVEDVVLLLMLLLLLRFRVM